ncbi:MAG: hypothetical protein QOE36_2557 [Gaiellaceae bacterium]|jgi:hypothetical protein|nr:hypothetical protein [Gaiellaceae bacterium]
MDKRVALLLRNLLDEQTRARDEQLCSHLVYQLDCGRRLEDILRDRYVRERTTPAERRRLARDAGELERLIDQTAANALVRRIRPLPDSWLPPAA